LADYLGAASQPVASRDLDFQGYKSDVELAAKLLGGRLFVPGWDDHTPMTGKTVFMDSEGYERTLDFLAQPYGLEAEDVRQTAIEVDIEMEDGRLIPLWVMHPERCLRSRVANSELPNKQTPLAWRQLDAAIGCVRAFGRLLLDEEDVPLRTVMKLSERVYELARYDRRARKIYLERGVDVLQAIVDDPRLPEAHRKVRLPQILRDVAERRERDRRSAERAAGRR
jgi:hypothetical protein